MAVDTFNKFIVGARGDTVVIGLPVRELVKKDALLLAAYLVSMSMATEEEWQEVLSAVQHS